MGSLGELLRLLGDETRLRILHMLGEEPLTVGELQELLDLSQSSVSGHLGKLKRAGIIYSVAEGSSHRYRLREDLDDGPRRAWDAVAKLTEDESDINADRRRVRELVAQRGGNWIERVAGSLHRSYAPGRTWQGLTHGFMQLCRLGRCVDIGAGDGALIELLAPRAIELICVDPSVSMIAAGQRRADELGISNCRFIEAAGEQTGLEDASCDTALFLQSLQYVSDPAASLQEGIRLLKPGGRLLATTLMAHDHLEAERYGHRHLGFREADIRSWCSELTDLVIYGLEPEAKAPHFQGLVIAGSKPG